MDPAAEGVIISKIRDGIFIGDIKAGSNQDLLDQFKISHIINVSGNPLPYSIEDTDIKYFQINWPENPNLNEKNKIITQNQISEIVEFIDDSIINGEGLLGFSLNGKNRICVVVILYLMKKFKWPLDKCYEYVSTKKKDISINESYKTILRSLNNKYFGKEANNIDENIFWKQEGTTDKNEILMKNTYMNEVQDYTLRKNNFFEEKSRYRIIRHVEWGDNKKYSKQMIQPGLVHYNLDKDLFLKKGIEDINIHLRTKPLRSCIKSNLNLSLSLNIASTVKKRKKEKIILEAENNNANNINIEKIDENVTQRSNGNNDSKNHKKKKNIFENILPKGLKAINESESKEEIKDNKKYDNKKCDNDNNVENNNIIKPDENALSIEKIEDIDDIDCEDEFQVNKDININPKNIGSPISIRENNKKYDENDNNNINNNIKNNKNQKLMEYTNDLSPISIREENESVKISNKDLKPILKNLLKIDPNLETLKKYIKSNRSNRSNQSKESKEVKEIKDNSCNIPKPKFNESNNLSDKTSPNKYANTIIESNNNNNQLTINSVSNNNDSSNTINLLPLHISSNANSPIDIIKNKSTSNKKDNKIYLLNLNLNINKNNTFNIKNSIFNTTDSTFKKRDDDSNFFVDSKGNTFYNPFSKFKSRRNNDTKNNINTHKFFSPNINYYLSKKSNFSNNDEKKEKIPIILNHNTIDINNQRNNNKPERKLFLKKNIGFEKNINLNNIIINKSNSLKHKEGKLFAPKLKISDINNTNAFKKNLNKNIINTFKSKTINIVKPNHISEKTKSMPKNFYERFHTNDNINEKYNYKNIPLKLMESKSNSKEKINKVLKKFEKNIINFSKQYCATLNQQNDSKIKNTSSSNEKKKKNRPSTAVFKNKNNKYNNEGFIIYNERNHTEFNNFRDNLISNIKKDKDKTNNNNHHHKKLFTININKKNNFNNIFTLNNNNLFIKTNNNDFNQALTSVENSNRYNRINFNNEKKIIAPKIVNNHVFSEDKRPKSGKKLKLASAFLRNIKKEF